jgi:hypothetical protein
MDVASMDGKLGLSGAKDETTLMNEDLAKSGLVYQDLNARTLDESSRVAVKLTSAIHGYVIPYFNIWGQPLPFFRVKLLSGQIRNTIKYLQTGGSPNHVYFPKNWFKTFQAAQKRLCVITEGEKKAAVLNKNGIPAIAFGGVDSWRNKTILIPKTSEIESPQKSNFMRIKLPSADFDDSSMSVMALGFTEFIDLCIKYNTTLVICYDTDTPDGLTTGPQRAAARLGYELRARGVRQQNIRQLILPHIDDIITGVERVAIDDYLVNPKGGIAGFVDLLQKCLEAPSAFPLYPNVRDHVEKILQRPKIDRKQMRNLSLAVVSDLDANGQRMYSPSSMQAYYYNSSNANLMKVNINSKDKVSIHETPFGKLLYSKYGLVPEADSKIMSHIGAQYVAEEPIREVEPHRYIAPPRAGEDVIRVQINNGQYIRVTGDSKKPYEIVPNGTDNILFESDITRGIDARELTEELAKQHKTPMEFWWLDVLRDVKLREHGQNEVVTALLYYLSPYLFRWRGLQLPIELVVGESGSGKSSLFMIRLEIISGIAKLRNTPRTMQDFVASASSGSGLHVTDNVQMLNKELRNQISDDLCRLVTEPEPMVEMRKYYTEADLRVVKINTVFGFTSIRLPFENNDFIQRAMVLELQRLDIQRDGAETKSSFDSSWGTRQIERRGGRVPWFAHQMRAIHLFLAEAQKSWNPNYSASHRLVHLEQAMTLMGKVFRIKDADKWVPKYLLSQVRERSVEADQTLQALQAFAIYHRGLIAKGKIDPDYKFVITIVTNWMEAHELYGKNKYLTDPRIMGRYMGANRSTLAEHYGIRDTGRKRDNRTLYELVDPQKI